MSDIVTEVWKKYLLQLQIHPLRTKAITSGVLAGCSDFAAQKISGIKKLQYKRLFLIMIYGFFYSGPFGHFLHKVMDKIFKGKKGSTTVGKKVILEQLTASPWNNLFFMMYYGLVVEGRTWPLVKSKIKNDYPPVQLTSWKFWPIINWVNYQYMPLQLRVLFHSLVASCWIL
ncbi:peroxisomal membrane protein PMP22-like isoform X2 [Chenopodium quinoa]|uniref:peroxisomal membrane protein PMP22-like isoform X2 n=1 Tax=Chenopodium quinoa TaxID=63459 RepID=UPI000B7966D4|nr:peroxisomal membrane protein PMP22-like isoform X2 [Chenopodium quinoa]